MAADLVATTQGLLASNLASDLNSLLQSIVDGTATIYDRAMDATYIATHEGGPYHRLFDGGHTIVGAVRASHDASTDDNVVQAAFGTVLGLLRDGTTPKGLPLITWDKATFDQVAGALQSHLNIPKEWFYDLNSYDPVELLGSSIGVFAVTLKWNQAETEEFARMAGGMGLASVASANPVLGLVTVVALARAYHQARQTGDYATFLDGQVKGAIGAGTTLAAVSLVGVAGGPAGVAILAGIAAGVLASKTTKSVSVSQLSAALADSVQSAARDIRKSKSRAKGKSPESATTGCLG